MKPIFVMLFTLHFSSLAFAKITAPTGFFENQRIVGDINKDKKNDTIIIWTSCQQDECDTKNDGVKIITQVYLGNTKDDELIATSSGTVCFRCGGMKGANIVGAPSIDKNGILLIDYDGGSRWSWSHKLKWRLGPDKKLKLIGSTYSGYDSVVGSGSYSEDNVGEVTDSDINYSTKKAIIKVIAKNLKVKEVKCTIPKDFTPPKFEDFSFENFSDGTKSCLSN